MVNEKQKLDFALLADHKVTAGARCTAAMVSSA